MQRWRQLDTRRIVDDRWLTLRADTCELPNGNVIAPYYVLEEADWVEVFAQNHQGEVLLVRQYRYAGDVVCTELPAGIIESGETPLNCAKREMLEETGYAAQSWTEVGKIFANPARQTNKVHVFIARGLTFEGHQTLDESEEISFEFKSIKEIKEMIFAGSFSQALDIAAFFMCLDSVTRGSL